MRKSRLESLQQSLRRKQKEKKARVFFVSPKDGAQVGTETEVEFGLEGMSVAPASEDINDKTKGHHHLIIDAAPIPYSGMVPMDEKHIHFGKGQTKAKIKLTPGKHTLTMQFADGAHKSYGKALSATITVNCRPDAKQRLHPRPHLPPQNRYSAWPVRLECGPLKTDLCRMY